MATERRVLSSLDLLPEECKDDVVWALARLNERQRSQTDILFELNDRLAVKGCGPISKSAFSRRSVRIKRWKDSVAERAAIYSAIAPDLTPEKVASADVVRGEFLKALLDEQIDRADTPKQVLELARAHYAVVSAQRVSADLKKRLLDQERAKLEKAVEDVAGAAEKAGHAVDAAAVLEIIRKAYRGEA